MRAPSAPAFLAHAILVVTHQVAAELIRNHAGLRIAVIDPAGIAVLGRVPEALSLADRQRAIEGTLAIGEGVVVSADTADGALFAWACPLTYNHLVIGGALAWVEEATLFPTGRNRAVFDVRAAGRALIEACITANLTNRALLEARLTEHRREQERAGFLHQLKREAHGGVAAAYLGAEAELIAALRSGDRGLGRSIINRILVVAYHQAGNDLARTRGLLLELVVLLRRTALESGASAHLLPSGERLVAELDTISDDTALARWLKRALESLFDCLAGSRQSPEEALNHRILRLIADRCREDLSRDALAQAVGVSPARLTRLVRNATGLSLPDALAKARIDQAKVLLERGQSAMDAALAVGFADASYFTKIFRKHTGMTPTAWRGRVAR